jgi:2'-5' RNA ligase
VRVFVAIHPPEHVRTTLSGFREVLSSAGSSVRWVAPASIHITLKFIGEVSSDQLRACDQALTGVKWNSFSIAVRNLGFFPNARKARILWAGLEADALVALAQDIDRALQEAGVPPDEKPFRPHMTLARSKDRSMAREFVSSIEGVAQSDFGTFLAERFYLVESVLKSGGAVYTNLGEYRAS